MATNLILIGYRGTGKTTVAQLLAQRLNWPHGDTDHEVEQATGKSIAEIFSGEGEETFRNHESRAVAKMLARSKHVISLGGGAILREENRQRISTGGYCVALTASAAVIAQRLGNDGNSPAQRPALTNLSPQEEIAQLLSTRQPLYKACADLMVETDERTPEEVVEVILQHLNSAAPPILELEGGKSDAQPPSSNDADDKPDYGEDTSGG